MTKVLSRTLSHHQMLVIFYIIYDNSPKDNQDTEINIINIKIPFWYMNGRVYKNTVSVSQMKHAAWEASTNHSVLSWS